MKKGNKYEKGKKRTNKQNKSITSSIFHLLGCHGNASSILKYRFNRDAVPLEPMRKHVQHHCEISRTDSNVSSLLTSFLPFFLSLGRSFSKSNRLRKFQRSTRRWWMRPPCWMIGQCCGNSGVYTVRRSGRVEASEYPRQLAQNRSMVW